MKKFISRILTSEREKPHSERSSIVNHAESSDNIKSVFPFHGFDKGRNTIPFVDGLSDSDLMELNQLLDWNCFVADAHGRRFGNVAWSGKRVDPQSIPDYRHLLLNDRIALADKHVLEIGCFEGIHTTSLCQLAQKVTAIDSRIENVVKTIVRTSLFGCHPTVFKADVEDWGSLWPVLKADVCHHIGVLYHLKDPVRHLLELLPLIRSAVLLDTHIATDEDATETYTTQGKTYAYRNHEEGKDVFSGMYDHAKWLPLATLEEIFRNAGFHVEVLEHRQERNGHRVLLFAGRK
jgi:tRNA (mo5U34)-methyltransferase